MAWHSRWTSSAKTGVGAALGASSEVWFTLSHGILGEIYYPRVDSACTRDLGLIVAAATHTSPKKSVTRARVRCLLRRSAFLVRTATDGVCQDTGGSVGGRRPSARRFLPSWVTGAVSAVRVAALWSTAVMAIRHGLATSEARRCCSRARRLCVGTGMLGAMARAVGPVCRVFGWMARAANARTIAAVTAGGGGNVALTGDRPECLNEFVLALGFGGRRRRAASARQSSPGVRSSEG